MSDITWSTVQLRLGDLIEWEYNPVTLSKHDAAEIKKSIDKFGLVLPLVANAPLEGGVRRLIDGHQRKAIMLMAKQAGKDTMVDVRVPSRPLEERECDELSIRLRRNAGEFDWDILANSFDLPDLLEWGFEKDELLGKGFDMEGGEAPEAKIDKAEELQAKWQVKTGDVWQCGKHRILCGDSTNAEDVAKILGRDKPDFTFTDPPYNVGVAIGDATDDNRSKVDFIAWCKLWSAHLPKRVLLTVGIKRLCWWDEILGDPQWIIAWVKKNGQGNTKLGGTNKWDAILVYGCDADNQTDLIELNNDYSESIKADGGHPTAKPVALWAQLIERFSDSGDVVFEPFTGTGTTLIACEQTGRIGRGIEVEPKYVSVVLERMLDMGLFPQLLDNPESTHSVGN